MPAAGGGTAAASAAVPAVLRQSPRAAASAGEAVGVPRIGAASGPAAAAAAPAASVPASAPGRGPASAAAFRETTRPVSHRANRTGARTSAVSAIISVRISFAPPSTSSGEFSPFSGFTIPASDFGQVGDGRVAVPDRPGQFVQAFFAGLGGRRPLLRLERQEQVFDPLGRLGGQDRVPQVVRQLPLGVDRLEDRLLPLGQVPQVGRPGRG